MDCPFCVVKFFTLQSLECHLLTHGDDRAYTCTFCAQVFNRRDALKRHWITCKSRLSKGQAIPFYPKRASGRKRRACDRCSKLKRACDSCFPCSNCLANRQDCSYNGVQNKTTLDQSSSDSSTKLPFEGGEVSQSLELNGQPSFPELAQSTSSAHMSSVLPPDLSPSIPSFYDLESAWWPFDFSISSPSAFWPDMSSFNENIMVTFDFLARFTSEDGLANCFRCGSLFQRQQIASIEGINWEVSSEEVSNVPAAFMTAVLPETSYNVNDFLQKTQICEFPSTIEGRRIESGPEISHLYSWAHHPLAFKTQEILDRLKETIRHKPKKSSITLEWSTLVENMCLHFFSPPNICKFLRIFWCSWYPNCPIIHKPTFDPLSVSPSLLSSMVIIGSCLSPEKRDNQNAAAWFNAVEEMVFDDEWLEEDYTKSTWTQNPRSDLKRLQSLQAAYFVCIFQNWEGSESSKQRIRRHRYNTLIAIARDLQPASVTHVDISRLLDDQSFEWKSFIKKEEKIRTLSYIFLLDGAFVIFNNMPPRMVVSELEMGITCPDECFQALSASECLAALKIWAGKVPHFYQYSIASVLETMFQRDLSIEKKELYVHFGILNLFIMVTALHTLVFQLQNAMAPPEAFQRIDNALQNWKDVWLYRKLVFCYTDDIEDANSLPRMWKRVGFMKDSCEFWLLCRVILERVKPNEHEKCTVAVPGRALEKFDQTNMKQVNDLMKQFESVSLTE